VERTPNGAPLWRRRRRNCTFTIAWGVVCALAGLTYVLVTGDQPESQTANVLSALGIVLLVVGMAIAGLGALGWVYAVAALPRSGDEPGIAPPPRFRVGVLSWVVLLVAILGAGWVSLRGA
jgi:uncharacterized membrane protein YidH (DUF202 family)